MEHPLKIVEHWRTANPLHILSRTTTTPAMGEIETWLCAASSGGDKYKNTLHWHTTATVKSPPKKSIEAKKATKLTHVDHWP